MIRILRRCCGPLVAATAISVLATACATTAGHDFPRPVESELPIGSATRYDIIAKLGTPYSEKAEVRVLSAVIPNGTPTQGEIRRITYSFFDRNGAAAEGVSAQRAAHFTLWNDKLVEYGYTSSFLSDSTKFPDTGIEKLARGKTTRTQVLEMFGPPGGRGIYPYVDHPGFEVLSYLYFALSRGRGEMTLRRLTITLDQNGLLSDYDFATDSQPIPAPPPHATPYVITMPARR